MNLEKDSLLRSAKWYNFCAQWFSLPCLALSMIAVVVAVATGATQLVILNAIWCLFNYFTFIMNSNMRDSYLEAANRYDEQERLNKIRELNPNKK